MLNFQSDLALLIEGKRDEERIEVPVSLLRAFIENKNEKVLSTQEAADLLGVSRPFVVKIVDSGELPSHKVGTHRRVRESDVLEWKTTNRQKRLQTLRELAAVDEELSL